METIKYKKMNLNVWDVGGQDSIRSLWRHYYTGTHVSMPLNSGFSVLMVQIYFRGLSVSMAPTETKTTKSTEIDLVVLNATEFVQSWNRNSDLQ